MAFSDTLNGQVEQLPQISAKIEAELRANAAAAVAADLRENCPCPVCGAVHHPHPAVPSARLAELRQKQTEVSKSAETLKKARMKLKTLEQQRGQAQQSAMQIRAQLADLQNRIAAEEATEKAIAGQMNGSATLAEMEQSVQNLRKQSAQMEQQEAQLRTAAAEAQSRAAAAAEALQKAHADQAEAQAQYQLVLLEYRSQPGVPQDTERPDEKAAQRQREEAQTAAASLAEQTGRSAESLHSGQQSFTQLTELAKQGESLQKQYEAAARLADLLSGKPNNGCQFSSLCWASCWMIFWPVQTAFLLTFPPGATGFYAKQRPPAATRLAGWIWRCWMQLPAASGMSVHFRGANCSLLRFHWRLDFRMWCRAIPVRCGWTHCSLTRALAHLTRKH